MFSMTTDHIGQIPQTNHTINWLCGQAPEISTEKKQQNWEVSPDLHLTVFTTHNNPLSVEKQVSGLLTFTPDH